MERLATCLAMVSTVATLHSPVPSVKSSSLRPGAPSGTDRRAVAGLLLRAGALQTLATAGPAVAFFESPTQLAVSAVATAQPKLSTVVAEVAEVSRKRKKMVADAEDDAYLIRFSRSVLDPASASMAEAAPSLAKSLPAEDGGDLVRSLPSDFQEHLSALYTACRAKSADDQLVELRAMEESIKTFLTLAAKAKQVAFARPFSRTATP